MSLYSCREAEPLHPTLLQASKKHVSFFMGIFVYMFVCVCACRHTACVWRPEVNVMCLPQFLSTVYFVACSLIEARACFFSWGRWPASSRDSVCLSLLSTGITHTYLGAWLFHMGSKDHRSSYLQSKCFTNQVISQTLLFYVFFCLFVFVSVFFSR